MIPTHFEKLFNTFPSHFYQIWSFCKKQNKRTEWVSVTDSSWPWFDWQIKNEMLSSWVSATYSATCILTSFFSRGRCSKITNKRNDFFSYSSCKNLAITNKLWPILKFGAYNLHTYGKQTWLINQSLWESSEDRNNRKALS